MAEIPAQPGVLPPTTVVSGDRTPPLVDFRELCRYRELLGFLAWRDLRVRYRQTILGGVWALLEPLVSVLLFTLLFNRMAGFQTGTTPYVLHCLCGTVLWTFFARSLHTATVSLVTNAGLVTKAYFPRLILPLAGQLAVLVDLACALGMYGVLATWYGVCPGPALLTLPVWIALAGLNALGVGLVLASINVRFRDVSQAVPFLIQAWLFASPIAYPLSAVPAAWRGWYTLNPLVGIVEGMRWALLPDHALDPQLLLPSILGGAALLWIGLAALRSTQRRLADIV